MNSSNMIFDFSFGFTFYQKVKKQKQKQQTFMQKFYNLVSINYL